MSMPRIRILPIVFMSRVIPCCALFPEIEPGPFYFADDLIQPHVLMQDLTPAVYFGGILRGGLLALQGSIFSRKGASSKPGTVQVS